MFTRDREHGERLAEKIEAGTVMVNDVLATYACPETPWGGVKNSGIGRTHSVHGLRDLCETRHVNHDRISLPREVWWYPYKPGTFRALLRGAKLLFGKRPWHARLTVPWASSKTSSRATRTRNGSVSG